MTTSKHQATFGIFGDTGQAERAIDALNDVGIPISRIGVVRRGRSSRDGIPGQIDIQENAPSLRLERALIHMGATPDQARFYDAELVDQRTLMTVRAGERESEVLDILHRHGAFDWAQLQRINPLVEPATGRLRAHHPAHDQAAEPATAELREERIVPKTESRESGAVVMHKVVDEVPARRSVDRRVENVDIEHVSIGKIVDSRKEPWEEDDVTVVPIYEERLVVTRELVLKEQVRIRRASRNETQEVSETLRRERLVIDDPGDNVHEHYAGEELHMDIGKSDQQQTSDA